MDVVEALQRAITVLRKGSDQGLLKEIDTRIVDSDENRSYRCTEFSSVDEQKWADLVQSRESSDEWSRRELSRREATTDVKPCGIPAGADH